MINFKLFIFSGKLFSIKLNTLIFKLLFDEFFFSKNKLFILELFIDNDLFEEFLLEIIEKYFLFLHLIFYYFHLMKYQKKE